jgi:hypothetical protein
MTNENDAGFISLFIEEGRNLLNFFYFFLIFLMHEIVAIEYCL